jgi:hypothetical protein
VSDTGKTLGTLDYTSLLGAGVYEGTTTKWSPGDTLSASATGATVDAFTGSVKAPSAIVGLPAGLSATTTTMIPIASGWKMTWTPDTQSGETVDVEIHGTGGLLNCVALPDSDGEVTVSSADLTKLGTGAGTVGIARYAEAPTTCANGQVGILATVEISGLVVALQ